MNNIVPEGTTCTYVAVLVGSLMTAGMIDCRCGTRVTMGANGRGREPAPVSWTRGRPNHAALRVSCLRAWAGVR